MGMTYGETSEVKPNLVELYERELDRYYRLLVEFSLAVENAVKTGSETRGYFYDWITRHIERRDWHSENSPYNHLDVEGCLDRSHD